MGSRPFVVPPDNNVAAARDFVLGHGCMAHGLERERGSHERSDPATPGPARQGAAGIFRSG